MTSRASILPCLFAVLIGPLAAQTETVSAASAPAVSEPAVQLPQAPVAYDYSQDALIADLTRELAERYHVNGDLQVEVVRPWNFPRSATQPFSLTVLETPALLNSTIVARVRLQAGQQTVAETSLLLRVQLLREVWIARAPTERGASFDPALFDTRRVDTLRERDTVSTSETTNELSFTRNVPVGHMLTWRDLSRRAMVRKGQVIEVAAVDGALTITTKALAMENGAAGETVRVRNLESKKEFTALVVADSRAEVRL